MASAIQGDTDEKLVVEGQLTADETVVIPSTDEFITVTPVDPWHRYSSLSRDSILVVEFSELEGPKPLISVPKALDPHFDANEFAVRVMTADYQASNKSLFPLRKDMQMLLTNEEQGVYTYVHYFTLFDIEARGFVRPYCIAYVTGEKRKLLRRFDNFRKDFGSLTDGLKCCNRRRFLRELREAIESLQSLENRAVSTYYELYYEGKKEESSKSNNILHNTDVLNVKYMRLHRELETAMAQVSDSVKLESPTSCHLLHPVSIDNWMETLISGTRSDRQVPLKDLKSLAPCAFERFLHGLDRILAAYHSSRNYLSELAYGSSKLVGSSHNSFGFRFGDAPTLLVARSNDRSFSSDSGLSAINRSASSGPDEPSSPVECDLLQGSFPSDPIVPNHPAGDKVLSNLLPSLPQILYPLLTGKFVMIYGAEIRHSTVVQMVHKLRNFVPHSLWGGEKLDSSWNIGDVRLSDFGDYKIFGQLLNRKDRLGELVPSSVRPYITLIDLNSDSLYSTKYAGSILSGLKTKVGLFPSDRALMSYVMSVLMEFSTLTYILYFFLYADSDSYRRNVKEIRKFSMQMGADHGDLAILRYLLELLKLQQAGDDVVLTSFQEAQMVQSEKVVRLKL